MQALTRTPPSWDEDDPTKVKSTSISTSYLLEVGSTYSCTWLIAVRHYLWTRPRRVASCLLTCRLVVSSLRKSAQGRQPLSAGSPPLAACCCWSSGPRPAKSTQSSSSSIRPSWEHSKNPNIQRKARLLRRVVGVRWPCEGGSLCGPLSQPSGYLFWQPGNEHYGFSTPASPILHPSSLILALSASRLSAWTQRDQRGQQPSPPGFSLLAHATSSNTSSLSPSPRS